MNQMIHHRNKTDKWFFDMWCKARAKRSHLAVGVAAVVCKYGGECPPDSRERYCHVDGLVHRIERWVEE